MYMCTCDIYIYYVYDCVYIIIYTICVLQYIWDQELGLLLLFRNDCHFYEPAGM